MGYVMHNKGEWIKEGFRVNNFFKVDLWCIPFLQKSSKDTTLPRDPYLQDAHDRGHEVGCTRQKDHQELASSGCRDIHFPAPHMMPDQLIATSHPGSGMSRGMSWSLTSCHSAR